MKTITLNLQQTIILDNNDHVIALTHEANNKLFINRIACFNMSEPDIKLFCLKNDLLKKGYETVIAEHFEMSYWSNESENYGTNQCY